MSQPNFLLNSQVSVEFLGKKITGAVICLDPLTGDFGSYGIWLIELAATLGGGSDEQP